MNYINIVKFKRVLDNCILESETMESYEHSINIVSIKFHFLLTKNEHKHITNSDYYDSNNEKIICAICANCANYTPLKMYKL